MENIETQALSTEATPAQTAPVVSVFEHPDVKAAGLKLQFLCAYHAIVLEKINAPLAAVVAGKPMEERKPIIMTLEDVIEMIFVCCTRPEALRDTLSWGREAFRTAAVSAIGDRFSLGMISQMEFEVAKHLEKALRDAEARAYFG